MGFDLNDLGGAKTAWVKLTGPLAGVEVLVEYASPDAGDKFRREMRRRGVMRETKAGREEPAEGREHDYLVAFCSRFVKDWRGEVHRGAEKAPYSAEDLARVMGAVGSALQEITAAVGSQELFFGRGESGST